MPSARLAMRGRALALVERIEGDDFFGQDFGGRRRRRLGMAGEEIFEFGVEAVLRLARLQIEKAENERTGKAEQRGGEGYAHAGDRRGEAGLQIVEHRRSRRSRSASH